jgi:hypothetical protein
MRPIRDGCGINKYSEEIKKIVIGRNTYYAT